jgi:hypothetical protein
MNNEELRMKRIKYYQKDQSLQQHNDQKLIQAQQDNIYIFNKLLNELEECENKRKLINEKILFIDKKIRSQQVVTINFRPMNNPKLHQPIINHEYNEYIKMFTNITKKKIDQHNSNYQIYNFIQNKYINVSGIHLSNGEI